MLNLIKFPSVLRTGYRYEIKKTDNVRYKYVEPMPYADKKKSGDCWIVDIMGNVDPSCSNNSIFFAKDLKNGEICDNLPTTSIIIKDDDGAINEKVHDDSLITSKEKITNDNRTANRKNKQSIRRKQRTS